MILQDFDACCARLPHVSFVQQWGGAHVWKVAGKIFAIGREGEQTAEISFKAPPMHFAMLLESGDFVPAPYLARAGWVALSGTSRLNDADLEAYLIRAHQTVFDGLPRKLRLNLAR